MPYKIKPENVYIVVFLMFLFGAVARVGAGQLKEWMEPITPVEDQQEGAAAD